MERNKTIRNLIIFAVAVIASGWVGAALNSILGLSKEENLGMLLWIVVPLGASLVLRAFAGDRWKDTGVRPRFRGNGIWYLVGLVAYPVIILLVLLLDRLFGWVTFGDFSSNLPALFLQTFGLALLPALFKNLFEEFAWRGYLTPKVNTLGLNAYAGHLLVAVVWWAWHIPYYLFFVDRAFLQTFTPLPIEAFLVVALFELIALAIVLGELRLMTNTTWIPVLLHTIYNVFPAAVLALGVVNIVPGMEIVAAFGPGGILPLVFLFGVGVWLRGMRRGV